MNPNFCSCTNVASTTESSGVYDPKIVPIAFLEADIIVDNNIDAEVYDEEEGK